MCLSLSVKTNYPIIEKPGVQNILTCENQGKQHKLSDNQFKCCFWKKKIGDDANIDDENIDWNMSFKKIFYVLQNQI